MRHAALVEKDVIVVVTVLARRRRYSPFGRHGIIGDVEPAVVRVQTRLPSEPRLAGLLGEKILLLEPHLDGELLRAGADEKDVIGVIHHRLRDERWRGDLLEAPDGAGALCWPV